MNSDTCRNGATRCTRAAGVKLGKGGVATAGAGAGADAAGVVSMADGRLISSLAASVGGAGADSIVLAAVSIGAVEVGSAEQPANPSRPIASAASVQRCADVSTASDTSTVTTKPEFRLWRPSGGLAWHWRAWRAASRYHPFRAAIQDWLTTWAPPCRRLVLVAPSAGWTLPSDWLSRFDEIVAIDLDPLAPWLFRRNHQRHLVQSKKLQWIRRDLVSELPLRLADWPDAAVLFCNVLGQLAVERDDHETVLAMLPQMLRRQHWASFHDCYTGDVSMREFASLNPFSLERRMKAVDLQRLGLGGEWRDHGTGGLFPEQHVRQYFPWWIREDKLHWIETATMRPQI